MKLSESEALERLAAHDHGVLSTLHADRGVDAVPAVYAVVERQLAVPVDTVKAKRSPRLQRERNLERDPRATLLVERWHAEDWSQLWWARANLRWISDPDSSTATVLTDALAHKYAQYADRPFAGLLVFDISSTSGWSAQG